MLLLLTGRYAKLVLVENAALGRLQVKTKKKKNQQHFEAFGLRLISSNWQIKAPKSRRSLLARSPLSLGHFYGVLKAFDSAQRSQRLSIYKTDSETEAENPA